MGLFDSNTRFDSGAGQARQAIRQRYIDAGWSEDEADQYVPAAARQVWQQGGGPGYQQRAETFEAPQRPTEAPQPTGQPSQQQMSPEQQQAIYAYIMRRRAQQQQPQQQQAAPQPPQPQQQVAPQPEVGEYKEASMRKTASQIADSVLIKIAAMTEAGKRNEHYRNAAVGVASSLPLVGAIAASASKPEGDPTEQFWGTLGGGLLGGIPGSMLGGVIGKSPRARLIGGLIGAAGGGYGAQRLMAYRRPGIIEDQEADAAKLRRSGLV